MIRKNNSALWEKYRTDFPFVIITKCSGVWRKTCPGQKSFRYERLVRDECVPGERGSGFIGIVFTMSQKVWWPNMDLGKQRPSGAPIRFLLFVLFCFCVCVALLFRVCFLNCVFEQTNENNLNCFILFLKKNKMFD